MVLDEGIRLRDFAEGFKHYRPCSAATWPSYAGALFATSNEYGTTAAAVVGRTPRRALQTSPLVEFADQHSRHLYHEPHLPPPLYELLLNAAAR